MTRGRLISLVSIAAVADGGTRACSVDGLDVLLCNVGGRIYAVENRCSHAASRLDAGRLEEHAISCPRHGARFDVRDGHPLAAPATQRLRTFDVVIDRGKINIVGPDPDRASEPARSRVDPLA